MTLFRSPIGHRRDKSQGSSFVQNNKSILEGNKSISQTYRENLTQDKPKNNRDSLARTNLSQNTPFTPKRNDKFANLNLLDSVNNKPSASPLT